LSATATLARTMARRHLLGIVMLGVLGGLGIGLAATAAAGARRADSAYTRLRSDSLAPDAFFDAEDLNQQTVGRLAALPEVTGIARLSYVAIAPDPLIPGSDGGAMVGFDADLLRRVYRPIVIEGRLAEPDAGDEVVVNEAMAEAADLRPGQQVRLTTAPPVPTEPPVPIGSATVVGVVRGIFDVSQLSATPMMWLDKSFLDHHRDDLQLGAPPFMLVRFVNGETDLPDFERHAGAVVGHELFGQPGSDGARPIDRTLTVQKIGLSILAAIAGLASLAAALQALSRLLDSALSDLPILVAIGLRPRQRMTLGTLLALPVAIVGAPVAVSASYLASPLIPTGFARAVDPLQGFRLDLLTVSVAITGWILALGGAALWLAWRRTGRPRPASDVGRTRTLLQPMPLPIRLGAEAALVPLRGRAGPASRAAMLAAAISVTGIVAVATFGASLEHLLATDELQGWSFDVSVGPSETDLDSFKSALPGLADDPAVEQLAWVAIVEVEIGGQPVEAYTFDAAGIRLHPTMRSGHPPSDGEIVLGADLLDGSGLSIGDHVTVTGADRQESLEVVGSATYPEIGNNSDLGSAASLTQASAQRIGASQLGSAALIRLAPGATPDDLARYSQDGSPEIVAPFAPPRIVNLEQIGSLPVVLAVLISAIGMLAVGHGLWVSIRARRRDLFVLTCLGFRPRDLRSMLLAQALSLAVVGLTFGGIAGTLIGKRTWSVVADSTAVVDRFTLPVASLSMIAAGTVAAAIALAVTADVITRRSDQGEVLRGE
jgi:hypothetical protein